MKTFITLESTSACTGNSLEILVVSRIIRRYRKILIIRWRGNFLSYLEYLIEIIVLV